MGAFPQAAQGVGLSAVSFLRFSEKDVTSIPNAGARAQHSNEILNSSLTPRYGVMVVLCRALFSEHRVFTSSNAASSF